MGNPTRETIDFFLQRGAALQLPEGVEPTRLFSRNVDVDAINSQRLGALPGAARTFRAVDEPAWKRDPGWAPRMIDTHR